jgi:hypothetical protein
MDKTTILKILEKVYDIYKTHQFTREGLVFIMLEVTDKSSRISNSRDINTLIDLGLIKITIFPNFKLTDNALKLLREVDAILPSEYLKITNEEPIKTIEAEIVDYIPDKTILPEIPKEKIPEVKNAPDNAK